MFPDVENARAAPSLEYEQPDGVDDTSEGATVMEPNEITVIVNLPVSQELLARDLRHNPAVALTIDTEVYPPKLLLIRGRAELDVADGIPEEYLQMNGSYEMTPQQRAEWESEIRSLYDGMVRIVITPTWVKLIDFETTLPTAIEELVQQRAERQRA